MRMSKKRDLLPTVRGGSNEKKGNNSKTSHRNIGGRSKTFNDKSKGRWEKGLKILGSGGGGLRQRKGERTEQRVGTFTGGNQEKNVK